jgi:hypothetical protein
MNWKVLAGAGALSLAMLLGVLIGSVAFQSAAAHTGDRPQLQPAAQAATTPATATTPGSKAGKPNGGFRGGPGMGHPGMGGPGMGMGGRGGFDGHGLGDGAATANGANRVISATTSLLTVVKGDLTYATGKMDTATAADWVSRADSLLAAAQSAATASQFGKAVATATAAGSLARAADLLMQQALGADKLPSYNQRGFGGPGRGHMGQGGTTAATPTQAQASRELAGLYNEIITTAPRLKATTGACEATSYLTGALNRYSTAYTAYQAGNFAEVHSSVVVSRALLEVTDSLVRAATAPNSPDTPVEVPAPNF